MRKKRPVTLNYKQISYLVAELSDLMQKEVKIVSRYYLHTFSRIVSEEYDKLKDMRNALIEKHGEPAEGGKGFEIKADSEKKLLFESDMNELLAIEVELTVPELYLSDLEGVKSDKHYGILFNLIND